MIRWVSALVTPLLAATPLTANQVTAVSLLFGLASIGAFMQGGWPWTAGRWWRRTPKSSARAAA